MQPHTSATLEQLENADWFANAGMCDGIQERSKIILLPSWHEAINHCSSTEWENLCLEAANQFRLRLMERSPKRFNQWNKVVTSLKPITEPLVQRKIEGVVREHSLPQVFEDTVQWDILHACIECEYTDIYQPGFYDNQAYWYIKGHFPCGWEGEFPNGTLIIL